MIPDPVNNLAKPPRVACTSRPLDSRARREQGMRHTASYLVATVIGIAPLSASSQTQRVEPKIELSQAAKERDMAVQIPGSIREEHQEIHSALAKATQAKGAVGAAARELAKVLDPHFKREEEIALPPLGLLESVANGRAIPETSAAEIMKMSDALRMELPRMLEEHKQIRAAVEKLRAAARADKAPEIERLADHLSLHARTEEEVLYPAAVLVGDVLRTRQRRT